MANIVVPVRLEQIEQARRDGELKSERGKRNAVVVEIEFFFV
jgi:hypothetical protein